jgi:hypothetical protein
MVPQISSSRENNEVVMTEISFARYLKESSFTQNYSLTKSGSFFFHWADWDCSCRFQKSPLLTDFTIGRLEGLTNLLNLLKERTVWLRYQAKLVRSLRFTILTSVDGSTIERIIYLKENFD